MEMIGRLVGTLFLAREYAHRAHLRVTGPGSYAKHVALGDFYARDIDSGRLSEEQAIEATVLPSDVILMVLVKGVHGILQCVEIPGSIR